MKIVKADAKGRVTGFEPGQTYTVGEQGQETTLRPRVEPNPGESWMHVKTATALQHVVTLKVNCSPSVLVENLIKPLQKQFEFNRVEVVPRGVGFQVSDMLSEGGVEHYSVLQ